MSLPRRRIVGITTLLVLVGIGFGVSGASGPGLHLPENQQDGVHVVRAVASARLASVYDGLPEGSELAFMAVDPVGNLVVSDAGRKSVLRFDAAGHLLTEWGPSFTGAMLDEPAGIAATVDTVYVVDRGTPRIFELDMQGRLRGLLSLDAFGTYGLNGLALDPAGNLYVADTGRNRILVFTPSGALLRSIGRPGSDLGGLTQPMLVAFGPDASMAIADWENSRITRWTSDFQPANTFSTGFRPFGVAVDAAGRIFVPDTSRRKIAVFTSDGTSVAELAGPNAADTLDLTPRQVAVSRVGQSVYVLAPEGLRRLDLEETAAVVQPGADLDLVSLFGLTAMLAVVVLAFLARRARRGEQRSVGSSPDGPVGLHPEDGTERQDQQPQSDQQLLVAYQAKREHQSPDEDHEPQKDSQTHSGINASS